MAETAALGEADLKEARHGATSFRAAACADAKPEAARCAKADPSDMVTMQEGTARRTDTICEKDRTNLISPSFIVEKNCLLHCTHLCIRVRGQVQRRGAVLARRIHICAARLQQRLDSIIMPAVRGTRERRLPCKTSKQRNAVGCMLICKRMQVPFVLCGPFAAQASLETGNKEQDSKQAGIVEQNSDQRHRPLAVP